MSVERLQGKNRIPLEDGEEEYERTKKKKRMAFRATAAQQPGSPDYDRRHRIATGGIV
jgi:hypothetical protein